MLIRLKVTSVKGVDNSTINVGLLSENTTVIVTPLLSSSSSRSIPTSPIPTATVSSSSSPRLTLSQFSAASCRQKLRVLPYEHRTRDTSYNTRTNTSSGSSGSSSVGIDSILDDDADDDDGNIGGADDDVFLDEHSVILNPQYLVDTYSLITGSRVTCSDSILDTIVKQIPPYRSNSSSSSSSSSSGSVSGKRVWYVGQLGSSSSSNNSSTIVRVTFDTRIRPTHVSLPIMMMMMLNVDAYDTINISIIDHHHRRPVIVRSVGLTRVKWRVQDDDSTSNNNKSSSSSSGSSSSSSSSIVSLDTLKLLLTTDRDRHSNGPFIIGDKAVITLKYNTTSNNDDSAYVVSISSADTSSSNTDDKATTNTTTSNSPIYVNLDDDDDFYSFLEAMELDEGFRAIGMIIIIIIIIIVIIIDIFAHTTLTTTT